MNSAKTPGQPSEKVSPYVQQRKNNDLMPLVSDRIETFSSIEGDPSLTPRSKVRRKLIRYIERSFSLNNQVPTTTVDFYRVGKVLGKGLNYKQLN